MKIIHITLIFFVIVSLSIQAMSYELDTMVTTGTRTPKLLKDSPVSIDVVTAEELAVISSGTVAEALNFIPGVVVTRSTKAGYNIQMQGFDGDHVLVLLNGQKLITPTGTSVDLDQINVIDIEQIEVYKGAASVMYGSSAMGGVVNIITKKVSKGQSRASYELGNYTNNAIADDPVEHRISASSSFVFPNHTAQFSYQLIDRPSFKYDSEADKENGTANEKHFLDGVVNYQFDGASLTYRPQYMKENRYRNEEDKLVPGQGFRSDDYFSEVERITQSLEYQTAQNFMTRFRYSSHEEFSGRHASAKREAKLDIASLEFQKTIFLPLGEWVSGVEFDNRGMHIVDDGIENKNRDSIQAFSQFDIYVSEQFELLAGIRMQHDDGFGLHHASRVSGMYRHDYQSGNQFRLGFGVGQSYRVPSLKELYYILDHSNVGSGYVVIGNEDLKPEESLGYNLNMGFDFAQGTQLEVSAHYSNSTNFIENEANDAFSQIWGVDAYVYQNIAKLKSSGADFSVKQPINENNTFNASYAYVDFRDKETNRRLSNRPYHQIKLNLNTSIYWLDTNVITYLVYQADEAYTLDDPTTADEEGDYLGEQNNEWISLNVSVTQKPTRQLTLRYGVQNILDEHKDTRTSEEYFDSRNEDSRRVYVGLSYEF